MLKFCHIHLHCFKGNAGLCAHAKLESLPHLLEPCPMLHSTLSSEICILKLVSTFTKQHIVSLFFKYKLNHTYLSFCNLFLQPSVNVLWFTYVNISRCNDLILSNNTAVYKNTYLSFLLLTECWVASSLLQLIIYNAEKSCCTCLFEHICYGFSEEAAFNFFFLLWLKDGKNNNATKYTHIHTHIQIHSNTQNLSKSYIKH